MTRISFHIAFCLEKKHRTIVALCVAAIVVFCNAAQAADKTVATLYRRMAEDINAGRPVVVSVYVALCDNDSQGIVPVKNKKICVGDDAKNNLYWASSGGLWNHTRARGWKRMSVEENPTPDIAMRAVWKKRLVAGGLLREAGVKGAFDMYLVGIAYRGERIRTTMVDYLKAVNRDDADNLTLQDGRVLEAGGKSHVIGWIGHDYFMDEPDVEGLIAETRGTSSLEKGVFGLACISDVYFRPAVERDNVHILALNTQLTFPSAFTVLGILGGLSDGKNLKGIHLDAARSFAEGQKRSVGTMLKVLSYGDKDEK